MAIRSLLDTKNWDDRLMFVKCDGGPFGGIFDGTEGYLDSSENSVDSSD